MSKANTQKSKINFCNVVGGNLIIYKTDTNAYKCDRISRIRKNKNLF